MKAIVYSALMAFVGLSACYYDHADEVYGNTPCDVSSVTWTNDIEPLIQSQCLSCHQGVSASGGLDLSTYANVKLNLSTMVGRMNKPAGDPMLMPQSGPLANCNLIQMDTWVAQGAPEN
ncbi:MAG: hypothetical protein P8N56_00180 [Schleiferiaceae bacterium]|nr:hypothetical protein [Schleiferiaceae bacterium]